ncbi:MAG: hypothetical protein J6N54_10540 [Bacteroidales bacterium]|nr:hypothetical protein [Bacteroidales bacterium]
MNKEYTLIDEMRTLMLRLGASLVPIIDIWILAGGDQAGDLAGARPDAFRIAFDTALESCRPEDDNPLRPDNMTLESEEEEMKKISEEASGMLADLGISSDTLKAIKDNEEWCEAVAVMPYAAMGICHVLLRAIETYGGLLRLTGQSPFAPLDSETRTLIFNVAFQAAIEDRRLRSLPVSEKNLVEIEETLELLGLIPHERGR